MDVQFENRYVPTRQMLVERARKLGPGPRTPTVIICLLVMIGNVVFSAAYGILDSTGVMLLIVSAALLVLYFVPEFYTNGLIKNIKNLNDGVMPEAVFSFGDAIEYHEGMITMHIEYDKLHKVKRLKYSYVLWFAKKSTFAIDPNGFTKGTFEEFKQFLRTKRPDLTIPE